MINKKISIILLLLTLSILPLVWGLGSSPAVDPNMVLYYKFNNDSSVGESYFTSNVVYDYSNGHLNNGTMNKPTNSTYNLSSGYFNDGSINFNLSSSYISQGNALLNNSKDFTFSIIVKPITYSYPYASYIISHPATVGSYGNRLYLYFNETGYLRWRGGSASDATVLNPSEYNLNEWIFIDAIRSVSTNRTLVYVNGILKVNISSNFQTNYTNQNLYLATINSVSGYYNGTFDEFILYNKSLTSTEILQKFHDYYGCIYPNYTNSISFKQSFCSGTYNINSSSTNGIITFSGSNYTFDCNGSILFGNNSLNGFGFTVSNGYNITIKNCDLRNYYRGVHIFGGNFLTFINFSFKDTDNVLFDLSGYADSLRILNSTFNVTENYNSSSGLFLIESNSTNTEISNCKFYNLNNMTTNYYIRINNNQTFNVTIRNSYFEGKANTSDTLIFGIIDTSYGGSSTINIINNTFFKIGTVFRSLHGDSRNILIDGNIMLNGTYLFRSMIRISNVTLKNNYVYGAYHSYIFGNASDLIVDNDTIHMSPVWFSAGDSAPIWYGGNVTNLVIKNSNFSETYYYTTLRHQGFVRIQAKGTNRTFQNNIIEYTSMPLELTNSENWILKDNIFRNAYGNSDSYSNNIYIGSTKNVLIINNTLRNACSGINLHNSSNLHIENNTFDFNYTDAFNNGLNCGYEPITAINVQQLWKTWADPVQNLAMNLTEVRKGSSLNVTIKTNNYTNYNVKLRQQGAANLSHDLTEYHYKKFRFSDFLFDTEEIYINSIYNNITTLANQDNYSTAQSFNVYYSNSIGNGYHGSISNIYYIFNLSLNYDWFYNKYNSSSNISLFNQTNKVIYLNNRLIQTNASDQIINSSISSYQSAFSYNKSIFNTTKSWTNALFYYPNGTVLKNKTISSNDGYMNVDELFDPKINLTYAFDNYTLTESRPLDNEPFWFSSTSKNSNSVTWHIASNLTDNVIVPAQLNVPVGYRFKTNTFKVIPKNGISYVPEYTLNTDTGVLTITNLNLSQSNDSNVVQGELIVETCTSLNRVAYKLVILISAVLILLFMGYRIYQQYENGDEIDFKEIIWIGITVIIALVMYQAAGQSLGEYCPIG